MSPISASPISSSPLVAGTVVAMAGAPQWPSARAAELSRQSRVCFMTVFLKEIGMGETEVEQFGVGDRTLTGKQRTRAGVIGGLQKDGVTVEVVADHHEHRARWPRLDEVGQRNAAVPEDQIGRASCRER